MTEVKESNQSIEHIIANELEVNSRQIWSAIKLLDNGATVPFIARYRKEETGGLTDTHLRMLQDRLEYLRDLERRRISVLQSIEEQGKLNPSLKLKVENAKTKQELEDLYAPFKRKNTTKASRAKEQGLEPLAFNLLKNPNLLPEEEAKKFINEDKGINNISEALSGASEILLEHFQEEPDPIKFLRDKFLKEAWLYSRVVSKKEEEAEKFSDYFQFQEKAEDIPSHRLLAILRGRKEKFLRLYFELSGYLDYGDEKEKHELEYISIIKHHFNVFHENRPSDDWISDVVRKSWKYKIRMKLEIDLLMNLKEKAEEEAIQVFAENVRELLLQAPAGQKNVLGVDPGYKNGVKMAVVDKTGKVLKAVTIYPHPPQNNWEVSLEVIHLLVEKYNVDLIAIGNGTASRETDRLVKECLKKHPEHKTLKMVISEAGASVYSASPVASKELPELDVSLRGAVSIARRLQDPLAELVKIDPKSIGVGQYQHDVNQQRLMKMLVYVVEDCVNAVGVELNTASRELLTHISGLSSMKAAKLVEYRHKNGNFKSRKELLDNGILDEKTFEQSAGFLRIHAGENPLDASGVHPETYDIVENILKKSEKDISEILGNTSFLKNLRAGEYASESFGKETVQDVILELEKPGRDPRPEFQVPKWNDEITEIKDLKVGMNLEGTVTNVTNFGAFIDIGVHQDGLVHISEIANEYVEDPRQWLKPGDITRVKVLEVDIDRKRIALSRKQT